MKKTALLFSLLISILTFSQIKFEKGSFIDNKGEKVICLIKDLGWKSNPTSFSYKLSADSEVKTALLKDVKQFEIEDEVKFIRATVQIDRSSENLSKISDVMEPKFVENQLFLKELVSGKANLYYYEEGNLVRFFFNMDGDTIRQLVYKRYEKDYNTVSYNKQYLDQLEKSLICPSLGLKEFNNLRYTESDLKKIFTLYNTCSDPNYVQSEKVVNKGKFNLAVRPRVNFNSLRGDDNGNNVTTILSTKTAFSAGLELEYIFPTNKNKWAVILEPSFQYYKNEGIQDAAYISGGRLITSIDYSAIEAAFGVRHYMYLNEDSRLFLNVSYVFAFEMNSSLKLQRSDYSVFNSLEVFPGGNFGLGFGYSFKQKFGAEFRYYTPRNLTSGSDSGNSRLNTTSLILSYSLF